ncbi:MAG: hypothetical protein JHD16_03895 [Solirubrobacteraceae bacterium]|nr:hypothetical protein [Solirubrobacteraceae bacterium]
MSPRADRGDRPARLIEDGRKLATVACVVLLVSLFLPWYEKSVVPEGAKTFVTTNLSAFGSFTWIEAAIILVDAAVLTLLWLRRTDRRVELPAGDGTMIAIAGGWIVLLLLIRVFDKPTVTGTAASVGLQWGLLVAMASAGALLAAGLAIRAIELTAGHDADEADMAPSP